MPTVLPQPDEVGAISLAPTTELAGLAQLAHTTDHARRLALVVELARALRDEDAARDRVTHRRIAGLLAPLPRRGERPNELVTTRYDNERLRLIIRVLCELVAYDPAGTSPPHQTEPSVGP